MSRRKKVLHLLWSGEIGGTEEYMITLLRYFDYSQYDIYLCFLSRKGAVYEESLKFRNINVAFIGIKNGFDIIGAFNFAIYLYKGKFDIIHSHMRNFISTAVISLFTFKIPILLTHHIGPVDVRLFKKNKRFYKLFSRYIKKIIAISNTVKEHLTNDLGIQQSEKIKVIHNCIDLNKFNSNCSIPSDLSDIQTIDKYVFGFVGRMEYFKRPRLFVEIALELIKKDKRFYFIMVGDGPELGDCKKIINHNNLGNHFKLLGFRRDIPNILRSLDAFLFTSVGEGFGIVLLEAMAMGMAVFATNDGAVPEIIKHKENGILLDTTDPVLIAQQIFDIVNDNQLIEKIKKHCVEDVHSKFDIQICVKQIENIYEEVLSYA